MSLFSKTVQTLEIDYDKLAQSIVKAQDKYDEDTIKNAVIEANNEIRENEPKHYYSKELLKFVIIPMLWIFIGLGTVGVIGSIVYGIKYWNTFNFDVLSGYINIIVLFVIFAFSLLFLIFSYFSYREIEKENDIKFISSMFSNLVSFVALIVAIIALLKGVA